MLSIVIAGSLPTLAMALLVGYDVPVDEETYGWGDIQHSQLD